MNNELNWDPEFHDCTNCAYRNDGAWNCFNPCGIMEGFEPCIPIPEEEDDDER